MRRLKVYCRLEETVSNLIRENAETKTRYERDLALIIVSLGETVNTVSGVDPLAQIREDVRRWERESAAGQALTARVERAQQLVGVAQVGPVRTGQRARRSSGPLANAERLREQRRQRVRNGEGIFIDPADEEALSTGGAPQASGSGRRRSPSPIPIPPPQPVPSFRRLRSHERLVPIEWPSLDEEDGGFTVEAAIDLTGED
jgi:hypothetical protein